MDQRIDYLSWDAYFMGIAILSAQRSKDPGTQVGACIVGPDNKILSVGYNGMPIGCADASELISLTRRLRAEGFTEQDIEKLWGGNFLRVMRLVQAAATPKIPND